MEAIGVGTFLAFSRIYNIYKIRLGRSRERKVREREREREPPKIRESRRDRKGKEVAKRRSMAAAAAAAAAAKVLRGGRSGFSSRLLSTAHKVRASSI